MATTRTKKIQQFTGCLLFLVVLFAGGCTDFPRYRTVHDGPDRKVYTVTGRVLNTFQKPVVNCQIYLTRTWPSHEPNIISRSENIPVAITNTTGDYSFVFEREGATRLQLYFDARDQGYKARYIDISALFESRLFQYTGNNPVVANAVLLPSR